MQESFVMPSRLDISSVSQLFEAHPAWREEKPAGELIFDCAALHLLTTAGAQFLVAAAKSCAAQGGKLILKQVSAPVLADLNSLGVMQQVGEIA